MPSFSISDSYVLPEKLRVSAEFLLLSTGPLSYIIKPLRPNRSFVWEGDSLDWKDLSAGEITKRVASKVCPGSIVLFHNAAKHTPEALPGIIEYLLQEGYTFVPISQIILPQPYTIDHTGRQCPQAN